MVSHQPKVFISYSHDSTAHSSHVLAFAIALRDHGIDVELDQFHTDEIIDWPRWCNEQTSREHSDFVLCVCTAEYYRRIEGSVPPEKGKGVYWEGSLLDDDIYDAKGNRRLIPVLFDNEPEASIPRFLRGWTFCRLHNFVLTDSGYEHLLRILTGQARVVKNPLGKVPVLPPDAPTTSARPTSSVEIAPTRLRHGAEHLFGREQELDALDKAWNDPAKHVLTIVAFGGVGKTSLVVEWMARQSAANWPGFECVFDWSFYSQGTREQGAASADTFIAAALEFFGDADLARSNVSPWDKGARLAQLVAQRRTLLVLDGLEPLQHPPGPLSGQLKDPALATLLRGLAQRNPGLCLVTTRERVAELAPFRDTTAPEWELQHLSIPAGIELLKTLGVRGSEREFQRLVGDVAGHALTLNLLGRYLSKAHQGDIRRHDRVKFEKADAKIQGGHAFKTMMAYEKWLAAGGEDGARQLAVLRLLGLFDRPADAGCLAALRREPPIASLTEPLVGLAEDDWNLTLSSLADCGLVSVQSDRTAIDTHPLIREYFAKQLREKNPEAWSSAHRRLYEHLKDSMKDKPQPTLEDLQPLYQAVAHGCQARLHQQACDEVYFARIARGNEAYAVKKLGAFGSELGVVACFFEQPWTRVSASLSLPGQAWLLNAAAFRLRALGRLNEALDPVRAGMELAAKRKDWKNASTGACNLSELELTLGELSAAVRDAEQSVAFADRSGNWDIQIISRSTLADPLHQAGQHADALAHFREAEKLQAENQPEYPLLYSLRGFEYCDLLLAEPERAAWLCSLQPETKNLQIETAVNACRGVEQRAAQTLKWAEAAYEASLLDIALHHLTLGRASLCRGILDDSKSEQAKAIQTAHQQLTAAVDGLRRAGTMDHLPRGLLSRAWLRFLGGDPSTGSTSSPQAGSGQALDGARADLDEAWEIAERGPMRLHMADIHLHRARLFRDKESLAKAAELIKQCGYWRRKEELADAEEAAKQW